MQTHYRLPGLIRTLVACLATAGLWASEHHGTVSSRGLPVPGATITVRQGENKFVTTTDEHGAYAFPDLADGIWTIEVEMFGFTKLSREAAVAPGAPSPEWELQVAPLSALKAELADEPPKQPVPNQAAGRSAARAGANAPNEARPNRGGFTRQGGPQSGFQRANVNAASDPATPREEETEPNGSAGNEITFADLNQSASDSLVVNGSVSSGLTLPQQNDWFGFERRFENGFGPGGPGGFEPGNPVTADSADAAGSGPGGPGGGVPGGPGFAGPGGRGGEGGGFRGGFGGGREGRGFRRDRGGPRGNLNAFGNGRRNRRQQYNGNLALILNNSALDARPYSLTGQNTAKAAYAHFRTTGMFGGPLKIPHLVSGQNTFFTINYQLARGRSANTASALVPTEDQRIGATGPAAALLAYYPLPNFTGVRRYNYQTALVSIANQNNVNARLSHTINSKNQVSGNFAWQSSNGTTPNLFQFVDTTQTTGFNTGLQYTYRFTTRLISNLRYSFSRQAADAIPFFAYTDNNVSGAAGIQGNDQDPAFYGPPTLMFSSGIASLSDGNLARNRNTTQQVGENLIWTRGAHNVTFGAEFRRQDLNQFSQQNPRGTLLFTGAFTGSDFSDLLAGLPATSSIAYGNADKYFRASWVDAFVNDDWRLNAHLSINAGLRWDLQAPATELYDRLVNIAVGPSFTSAIAVCAGTHMGCASATDAGFPNSLLRPNYHEFQPRIGLAWRPFTNSSMVVRAGYGLYYNTSVYQSLVAQMAQQTPLSFSVTQANSKDPATQFTLQNPFVTENATTLLPTFGIDPNFQIGYLHYWQLSIQQGLPASLVATVTYNGNKGTHQMQQFLPNTFPSGIAASAYPAGYVYVSSGANSKYNAISGQLQRRFRSGLAGNVIYTFSKAIDDAQGVGGRGGALAQYAQNWLDLSAERSVSSFNRTHTLNMNMQWSTGQGVSGGGLLSGRKGALAKDWTFTTAITLGSGLPLTPIVLYRVAAGTGFIGTVRAEYVGGPLAPAAAGYGFNPDAFGMPFTGQWGNAGRNIIPGPLQFSLNASAGRVFRLAERRSLDLRFEATNALNHVSFSSWNATLGNRQFGLPTSAGPMRTLQANLRFRF